MGTGSAGNSSKVFPPKREEKGTLVGREGGVKGALLTWEK